MSFVIFHNADVTKKIVQKRRIRNFIFDLFLTEERKLSYLNIIFCSDEYLLTLNKQFLQHDYYTDILTFNLSEDKNMAAEIYISVDRALENSYLFKSSFQTEIVRLIFHGILHLLGYDDKTNKQKELMTKKEDELLLKFASFHVKQ